MKKKKNFSANSALFFSLLFFSQLILNFEQPTLKKEFWVKMAHLLKKKYRIWPLYETYIQIDLFGAT